MQMAVLFNMEVKKSFILKAAGRPGDVRPGREWRVLPEPVPGARPQRVRLTSRVLVRRRTGASCRVPPLLAAAQSRGRTLLAGSRSRVGAPRAGPGPSSCLPRARQQSVRWEGWGRGLEEARTRLRSPGPGGAVTGPELSGA